MGRSQRHMILEQGAPANGEAIAEGQPSPVFISQASEAPVYDRGGPLSGSTTAANLENLETAIGAPGGPLQGSTVSSAVPSELDGGTTPPDGEDFRIGGLNPEAIPAGYPDLSVGVFGQGFVDGAVVVFDGTDMETDFVNDNQLRFLCPSSEASAGVVQVTVRQGGDETEPIDFAFLEDEEPTATKRKKKS